MFMRRIEDEKLAQNAYLIGCPDSGEAIVIDPQRDVDRYVDLAGRHELTIVAVAETHVHADFLSGARELAERGVLVLVSGEGGEAWAPGWLADRRYRHRLLRDEDRIAIGGIELEAVHTAGHTPEHVSFLVTDRGAGASEPVALISGDFLLVGDLGRPDLLETTAGAPGAAEAGARALCRSARWLDSVPEFVQVWPGHGAGSACGKAPGAMPSSTIGYERLVNPALARARDEAAFVEYILAGQPEPPLYFARMKRRNRDGPAVLGELPRPPRMTPGELARLDPRETAIIDMRPWSAFRAGHVPGALSHPSHPGFTTDVGSLVREDEDVVLIVEPAGLEAPIRDLVRIGLDRVAGWLDPADLAGWGDGAGPLVPLDEIPAGAIQRGQDDERIVLDVRRGAEVAEAPLPGALHIPHTRLASRLDELPRDRRLLVACRTGRRSALACAFLQRAGFRVCNLAGGVERIER